MANLSVGERRAGKARVLPKTNLDRYGLKLVEIYETYRGADSEIEKCKTSIEYTWYRIHSQLECLKKICEHLDHQFIRIQLKLLAILNSELLQATAIVDKLFVGSKTSKLKYVFLKRNLNSCIASLDVWQQKFDPHWYREVLKVFPESISVQSVTKTNPDAEPTPMETARSIRIALSAENPSGLQNMFCDPIDARLATMTDIEGSSAKVLRDVTKKNRVYIIDPLRQCQATEAAGLESDVRFFARKLRAVNPARFSMLQCKRVQVTRSEANHIRYDLVFRYPTDTIGKPLSLAALIASARRHSLSERLKIAQQLVRAVSYVHALDFVHKNIRPESMLAFDQPGTSLGSVYLVGFEMFRSDGGRTSLRGDSSWEKNIYRHPQRQGDYPERPHLIQHDIYSLGVCLLHIGLWTPLGPLIEQVDREALHIDDPQQTHQTGVGRCVPLDRIKGYLKLLAETKLPSMMGDRYRDVVINCLTCLDAGNLDFADENVPDTKSAYVERVCQHLTYLLIALY